MEAERALADALLDVSRRHTSEPDIRETTRLLAGWSRDHARALATGRERLGRPSSRRGWQLRRALFEGTGQPHGTELLQDLLALTSPWRSSSPAGRSCSRPRSPRTIRTWNTPPARAGPRRCVSVPGSTRSSASSRRRRSAVPAPPREPSDWPPTVPSTIWSRGRGRVPLAVGVIAGLSRAVATRRRGMVPSTASAILAGLSLGWMGTVVIQALADRRGGRHLAHDQHRGLRGPTRTARLRDA